MRAYGFLIIAVLGCLLAFPAAAQLVEGSATELPPPPELNQLKRFELRPKPPEGSETGMPFDIRNEAMKESALSYGARGGLAWRTYHIRREMETRARYLDKVFDF